MHQRPSGVHPNTMSSHAALLLSASPTIITSPLHNNTNNPQNSPSQSSTAISARKPTNTPLLVTSASDNEGRLGSESPTNISLPDGYINFKKPQNEIFKKLDGKIQKIVAAHSSLNKLYALNDFSTLGPGSKRPFELPPQLPPPPPWVPKVNAEFGNDEPLSPMSNLSNNGAHSQPGTSTMSPDVSRISQINSDLTSHLASRGCSITIDSAISKIHQRRQQQQIVHKPGSGDSLTIEHVPSPSSQGTTSQQQTMITQQIKEFLESLDRSNKQALNKNEGGEKKKFQQDLIAVLKQEIAAAAKSANYKFSSPPSSKQQTAANNQQKSLLLKSSPQTLYNTIRRETSLLLNRRSPMSRPSVSLACDQQLNRRQSLPSSSQYNRLPIKRVSQIVKVVVPPQECRVTPPKSSPDEPSNSSDNVCISPQLTYQVIRAKLKIFQDTNRVYFGIKKLNSGIDSPKRKLLAPKSLDIIVDRLQARCSPTPNDARISSPFQGQSLHQQIINSSASLLQSSRALPTMSAPTPIPVLRQSLSATYVSKMTNMKSRKVKRSHNFGLKISNHTERECPPPNHEKITVEQFAKCLNLVRTNDASLQKQQQRLMHSESRWRIPLSNRPLRLRRIKGDRVYMPASASYKATRKVGLQ